MKIEQHEIHDIGRNAADGVKEAMLSDIRSGGSKIKAKKIAKAYAKAYKKVVRTLKN